MENCIFDNSSRRFDSIKGIFLFIFSICWFAAAIFQSKLKVVEGASTVFAGGAGRLGKLLPRIFFSKSSSSQGTAVNNVTRVGWREKCGRIYGDIWRSFCKALLKRVKRWVVTFKFTNTTFVTTKFPTLIFQSEHSSPSLHFISFTRLMPKAFPMTHRRRQRFNVVKF